MKCRYTYGISMHIIIKPIHTLKGANKIIMEIKSENMHLNVTLECQVNDMTYQFLFQRVYCNDCYKLLLTLPCMINRIAVYRFVFSIVKFVRSCHLRIIQHMPEDHIYMYSIPQQCMLYLSPLSDLLLLKPECFHYHDVIMSLMAPQTQLRGKCFHLMTSSC